MHARAVCIRCMQAVASRRSRGPIDNISYLGPLDLWTVANHRPYCGVPNITNVPNSVNDMAYCIISFTSFTDFGYNCTLLNTISWYRTMRGHVWPNTSCNIDLIFTP